MKKKLNDTGQLTRFQSDGHERIKYLRSISETRTEPGPEGPMPPRACPGVGATREVDEATEGGPLPDLTEGGLPDGGGIAGEK